MATIMQNLLAKDDSALVIYRVGDSVKGKVIDVNPSRILLELPNGSTGMITKREIGGFASDDEVAVGSEVESTIIEAESDQGLVVLSLRRASQDTAWAEINVITEEERTIKVKIEEANKGGLMARYKGLRSFLPVSQLMPKNYPRVEGADSAEILKKLQAHIGKEFAVKVINSSREEGKIIISEKKAHDEQMLETLKNIQIGDVVEGVVSGIVKFGIFVALDGLEGLVHVSELEWGHVSDPGRNYSVGDKIEVLIIGKEGNKLSFSVKQLSEDPWMAYVEKYPEGSEISGRVTRWNDQGVFIEISREVQGLFSIDQFGVDKGAELTSMISDGDQMSGIVDSVNTKAHRLELQKV